MRYRRHEMATVSAVVVTDKRLSVDARLLYVLLCVMAGRADGSTDDDALMTWLARSEDDASELFAELLGLGYLTLTVDGYLIEE